MSRTATQLGVFGYEVLNFSKVPSDVQILIRRTKHELIIKLITHE